MKGILILSHGSSEPIAIKPLIVVARKMEQQLGVPVTVAFLNFNEPTIEQAVHHCYAKGICELLLLPYFLSDGYLMRKAMQIANDTARQYKDLKCVEDAPLGQNIRLGQILLTRYRHSLRNIEERL